MVSTKLRSGAQLPTEGASLPLILFEGSSTPIGALHYYVEPKPSTEHITYYVLNAWSGLLLNFKNKNRAHKKLYASV